MAEGGDRTEAPTPKRVRDAVEQALGAEGGLTPAALLGAPLVFLAAQMALNLRAAYFLTREVARGLPHLLVSALVLPAGLVAGVHGVDEHLDEAAGREFSRRTIAKPGFGRVFERPDIGHRRQSFRRRRPRTGRATGSGQLEASWKLPVLAPSSHLA